MEMRTMRRSSFCSCRVYDQTRTNVGSHNETAANERLLGHLPLSSLSSSSTKVTLKARRTLFFPFRPLLHLILCSLISSIFRWRRRAFFSYRYVRSSSQERERERPVPLSAFIKSCIYDLRHVQCAKLKRSSKVGLHERHGMGKEPIFLNIEFEKSITVFNCARNTTIFLLYYFSITNRRIKNIYFIILLLKINTKRKKMKSSCSQNHALLV